MPTPTPAPASGVSVSSGPALERPWPHWPLAALLLIVAVAASGLVRLRPASPIATPPGSVTPPRLVRWIVQSVPPGAEVVRADGQLLGTTPWELDRPPGPGETVLTLRHPGCKDKTLLLSHSTDVKTEVYLDPAALTPAPPAAGPEVTERESTPASPLARRRKQAARGGLSALSP